MSIQAVLFDKDGTLVDFDATWGPAGLAIMRDLAGADEHGLARLIEVSDYDVATLRFRATSPVIAGSTGDYGPDWAAAVGRAADGAFFAEMDRLFLVHGLACLKPLGRPARVFDAIAERAMPMGIATNDTEASARAQMAALDLDRHLAFYSGWDSGHGRKPGPGPVTAFADAIGLAPHQIALVGDSLHDLHAARAAGALAVAVLTGPRGTAARAELAPFADVVLTALDELPAVLA
ncbi:HAD family hydrolase [Blastochloris viridis]|uniref:phosphoglycolate phosphatase n=1 Tax=Blastochloris viridis TaxID=1079 RepID=A0A0H5BQ68_BLAVI|nr:HAD-IA family hydrolase [Blastochloris viridis]ALK09672.1 Phosphoglycolate phosphatase [Blastochloris viridis]BAS00439.1 HAD-superfamily hydrolase [Blastochloris viridis]CUU42335.1 Phosphoglycolate phosphatase [Blastochloris viridis]